MDIENKINEIKQTINHLNNELKLYKMRLKENNSPEKKQVKSIPNSDLDDPKLFKDWYFNLHLC